MIASPCPQREELQAFRNGLLSGERAEQVAVHVERCSRCEGRLEELGDAGDSLLVGLRQVPAPPTEYVSTLGGDSDVALAPPGYELLGVIGRGGMGIVYRAREVRLNREVAVKLVQPRHADERAATERFFAEAQITGQLQHPGIPAVHELGTLLDGRPFLAMKLVKGRTLQELLEERLAPGHDRGRFIAIFEQVCHAVGYAHAHRVLHRDLKPGNIMVGAHGEVQVMDWGLAKVVDDSSTPRQQVPNDPNTTIALLTQIDTPERDSSATRTGSVLGTPAYMPPEQAAGQIRLLDARSDVFGLGAILCQILTGRPPYRGADADAVRILALRGEVAEAFAALDGCGAEPDLIALCKRCLAFRQEDRPADGSAVAQEVARIRHEAEERARQAELARERALVREAEQRKRRRVWLALAASLLVGLIATAALAFWLNDARQAEANARQFAFQRAEAEARERSRAEAAENAKSHALYVSEMRWAWQAWEQGNVDLVATILQKQFPEPGKQDLRGFEWHYLDRLARRDHLPVLTGHHAIVHAVTFSPDGQVLASGDGQGVVKLWDVTSRRELRTLAPRTGIGIGVGLGEPIRGAGLVITYVYPDSPAQKDGRLQPGDRIVGVADRQGKMVESEEGKGADLVKLLAGEEGTSVELLVAKADLAEPVRYTLPRGRVTFRSAVESVAFHPNGRLLAVGYADGNVVLWDHAAGRVVGSPLHADRQTGVGEPCHAKLAFTPDGKMLATAGWATPVTLRDLDDGRPTGSPTQLKDDEGHPIFAGHLAFTPDGKTLIVEYSRRLRLIDLATRRVRADLSFHLDLISTLAVSRDGASVAVAGRGGAVVVDRATATIRSTVAATHCWAVAFSPDGQRLLMGNDNNRIDVVEVQSGRPVIALRGHAASSMALSPDGRKLASGGFDRQVILWDPYAAQETEILAGLTSQLSGLAFSPDSKNLFLAGGRRGVFEHLASSPGEVICFHRDQRRPIPYQAAVGPVALAAYSPDGQTLAVAAGDLSLSRSGTVRLFEARTGKPRITLTDFPGPVFALAFSHDGTTLAIGSGSRVDPDWSGEVRLYDLKTGKSRIFVQDRTAPIIGLSFLPGDALLLGICTPWSGGCTVKLWEVVSGQEKLHKSFPSQVTAGDLTSDGKILALGFGNSHSLTSPSKVVLLHLDSGEQRALARTTRGCLYAMAASPDGKLLVTASHGGFVDVWDVSSGTWKGKLDGHHSHIGSLAFSSDGTLLAGGGGSWTVSGEWIVWDWPSGKKRHGHTTQRDVFSAVSISPDGKQLVTGTLLGQVLLWDILTGKQAGSLPLADLHADWHTGAVLCLAVSPNGKLLATGSEDRTVKLWNTDTRQVLATLPHDREVKRLAWSADGKMLATVAGKTLATTEVSALSKEGWQDVVHLWDIDPIQLRLTLPSESREITALAFAPIGHTLAWTTQFNEVKVLDAEQSKIPALLSSPDQATFVECLAFTPDGKTLLTSGSGHITQWDHGEAKVKRTLKIDGWICALSVSPDGRTLASLDRDGAQVRLWHLATGELLFALPVRHKKSLEAGASLAFSPDGQMLVVRGSETVELWYARAGAGAE